MDCLVFGCVSGLGASVHPSDGKDRAVVTASAIPSVDGQARLM